MQGAAGIAAFLLRLARVIDNGPDAPVVDRPDQWWAVPARLRTVQAARTWAQHPGKPTTAPSFPNAIPHRPFRVQSGIASD
jgi:hypothetical protein